MAYLVRKGQGELDLVGNSLSVATALDRDAESGRARSESSPGEPKRAHCAIGREEGGGRCPSKGWVELQRWKSAAAVSLRRSEVSLGIT
jgi:hypothetical protein